jgi:hypothetical protein
MGHLIFATSLTAIRRATTRRLCSTPTATTWRQSFVESTDGMKRDLSCGANSGGVLFRTGDADQIAFEVRELTDHHFPIRVGSGSYEAGSAKTRRVLKRGLDIQNPNVK